MEAAEWLGRYCDMWTMAPVSISASQWGGRPGQGAWARQSGTWIAIYINSGASFTFNTTGLGSEMSVRWKDVDTGARVGDGTTPTSSSFSISNPFGGNRAIVVMKRGA
jgi:hypothetical protein